MNTPRTLPTAALSLHPDAALVPEMPADQYATFLADVKSRGVLTPIEVLPGTRTVIEGRTRLKAATDAGLPSVPVVEADLREDGAVAYMIRAALLRRQLTSSQRAALAVELEAQLAAAAKGRQRDGGKKAGRGRPAEQVVEVSPPPVPAGPDTLLADVPKIPLDAVNELASEGVHTVADLDARVSELNAGRTGSPKVVENRYSVLRSLLPVDVANAAGDALVDARIPQPAEPSAKREKARDQAAAIAGTNPRYVSDAKAVKKAAPEVFAKVKAGSMTLAEAKRVTAPKPSGFVAVKPEPAPVKPPALVSFSGGLADARRTATVPTTTDPLARAVAELEETAAWLTERADVLLQLIEGVSARSRAPLQVEVARLRGRADLIRQTARGAKGGAA